MGRSRCDPGGNPTRLFRPGATPRFTLFAWSAVSGSFFRGTGRSAAGGTTNSHDDDDDRAADLAVLSSLARAVNRPGLPHGSFDNAL